MMLLKTIIATLTAAFTLATLFLASATEGHGLATLSVGVSSTHGAGPTIIIANCFTGPDCNGYPHDVSTDVLVRTALTDCGTLRGPLGKGEACRGPLCTNCTVVTDSSTCIKEGPFMSYCFGGK